MMDDSDEYLNADVNDFETDEDFAFEEVTEEETVKPTRKKPIKKRRPRASRAKSAKEKTTTARKKPAKKRPKKKAEAADSVPVGPYAIGDIDDDDDFIDSDIEKIEEVVEKKVEEKAVEAVEIKDEGPPPPPEDHVVHIYEHGDFKRTIVRLFTAEMGEAFASEYNKTGKTNGRFAIVGKEGVRPKKKIPWNTSPIAS